MQKNLKKGQPFEKKKKKKIERGCHFGKKRIFWRVNTQEKDDESFLAILKTTRAKERAQSTRNNKREEELFFRRFVSFCRAFFPFC